jgi:hypothetical protein
MAQARRNGTSLGMNFQESRKLDVNTTAPAAGRMPSFPRKSNAPSARINWQFPTK